MDRVKQNWKSLIDALVQSSSSSSSFELDELADGFSDISRSLDIEQAFLHIEAINQLASEIELESDAPLYREVAGYLFQHAYDLLQQVPKRKGKEVLQFRLGLKNQINELEQNKKRHSQQIEKEVGLRSLITFHNVYKDNLHKDNALKDADQIEEGKWNLHLLAKVIQEIDPSKDSAMPIPSFDNILQSDSHGNLERFESPSEVTAAIKSLDTSTLQIDGKFKEQPKDIYEVLKKIFGFQAHNVNNQREHLVLMLANAHVRVARDKRELSEQACSEQACHEVCDKIMENFNNWCEYLHIPNVYKRNKDDLKKELLYTSLYLLIWGEAANLRFIPECLCYVFYKMAEKLESYLKEENCEQSKEPPFLDSIQPLYCHLSKNMTMKTREKQPCSKQCNYDDFNEYFWSPSCLQLSWPLPKYSDPNFTNELIPSKKHSFVEHRTFLHLYHSFHRLWILLILAFQVLVVVAFSNHLSFDRVKLLLSVGPTYFLMMFIESALDLCMMIGALTHAQSIIRIRIIFCILWFGGSSGIVCYLYLLVLTEEGEHVLGTSVVNFYVFLLVIYVACHILPNILLKIPTFQLWMRTYDQWGIARIVNWLNKEYYYVGRRIYEETFNYTKYALFWMLVLSLKFCFSYFFQIKPLVEPSITIAEYKGFIYHGQDIVFKGNHNALTILTLWCPIVLIYLVDIQIWYTLVSSILGGFIGVKHRLGEIRSLDMLRRHFHKYPAKFMIRMVPQNREKSSSGARETSFNEKLFASYWNEIIHYLREEDYIDHSEKEFLLMPEGDSLKWPLFLLVGKVNQAVNFAKDQEGSQDTTWKKIKRDVYMHSAVLEAYKTFTRILLQILNGEFQSVLKDDETIWKSFQFKELPDVVNKASELLDVLLKFLQDNENSTSNGKSVAIGSSTSNEKTNSDKIPAAVEQSINKFFDKLKRSCNFYREKLAKVSIEFCQPAGQHMLQSDIRRLQHILKGDESEIIPKNLEARRRLNFFANSLFMDMPLAETVKNMRSFSVITPFSSGDVIYTIEQLNNREDGISLLFYLQKLFPDEWKNFLQRLNMEEDTLMKKVNQHKNLNVALKLRLWASYRGQTLARTVRGMMYYHKALQLQTDLESSGPKESSNKGHLMYANMKFTYILTCEMWAKQQQQQKRDILDLLKTNKALRVAYIDLSDQGDYFSKLVKGDAKGREREIYKIKLPGNPWIGEPKSESQNHAIIFTRGDALQSTAADQDNYFEEALKMRNLLEEFRYKRGLHPPSILGVRAHLYTGSVSSIAWFMSNREESWATLGQRVLAKPLRVRMQYGHGDVFNRIFHITRGGISKASWGINTSEDIFAGYNSVLRNGSITHHEYIQVGKGCPVSLNQITMFQGKVAGGNGEQCLSRDLYRLGQHFDFFRMMSFYVSSIGFYVCCMMVVLIIYISLYGRAYLAFSGIGKSLEDDTRSPATDTALTTVFLFQLGIIAITPIMIEHILEQGAFKALVNFVTMQIQLYSIFYTFLLGSWAHYFGRAILHGVTKEWETGSGFVVRHIRFAENYRLYSRSHFVKGLEILMLLLVSIIYGFEKTSSYIILSLASWLLVASWLFAPFLFNPAGFEWQKTVEDFSDWTNWILYKSGIGLDVKESWETWWNNDQEHIHTCCGRIMETILCLRFFFFQYGVVYKLHIVNGNKNILVYAFSWLLFFIIVVISKVFTISQKTSVKIQLLLRLFQGIVSMLLVLAIILLVIFTSVSIGDIFALLLAFIPTGWAIISIAIAWKPQVKRFGVWRHVRKMAKLYDAAMGMLLFTPLVILSWFPFVSTFQTRIMFNQAFSRGLEISLVLGGEQLAPLPSRSPGTPTSLTSSRSHAKFS